MRNIFLNFAVILTTSLSFSDGIFFNYVFSTQFPEFIPIGSSYDFVIVGSGSAGSALARRLSENPEWRILLLEVGKRPTIVNDIPYLAPALQFTDYTWKYLMEKTPGVCLGMVNQQCPWPRGRGLGGTTLINYMIYTRGHRKDFEKWEAAGNPGWGYEDVLPYYLKSEDVNLEHLDPGYHGQGGPLSVEDARWRSKIIDDIIDAGVDLGYPYVDYNGRNQEGISYVHANTRRGIRDSAYRAFLAPVEDRPNLDILTEARATRLLIYPETTHVYGVEYIKNKRYFYVNVTKEVILSAGAFNSPQLLMLSGIGPKTHLESLGIPVLLNLPVGRNLHDHITYLGLYFIHQSGDTGLPQSEYTSSVPALLEWWRFGTGPLTSIGGVEALAYINTKTSKINSEYPDMELIIINARFGRDVLDILKQVFGFSDEVADKLFDKLIDQPLTIFFPMHLKPHSIGYLELKSQNPYHWPKFYGNHLTDPENLDVKAFIAAIRAVQNLMRSPKLKKYNTTQLPVLIPSCEHLTYDSDEYLECGVRHISTTLHHQVGTCKMGPKNDETAVVDNELKVHGMKGIRIADTSIIPFALNAHTNAPAFMIGEKAADFIKKEWRK